MKQGISAIAAVLFVCGISASASAQSAFEVSARANVDAIQSVAKATALADAASKCDVLNQSYAALNVSTNDLYDQTLSDKSLVGTAAEDEVIQSLEALTILKSRYGC